MIPLTLKTCEPAECLNLHHAITVNHSTAAGDVGQGSDLPHPRRTCWLCLTEHAIAASYLVFSNMSHLKCSTSGDLWPASTDMCKFKTAISGGKRCFANSLAQQKLHPTSTFCSPSVSVQNNWIWQRSVCVAVTFLHSFFFNLFEVLNLTHRVGVWGLCVDQCNCAVVSRWH